MTRIALFAAFVVYRRIEMLVETLKSTIQRDDRLRSP